MSLNSLQTGASGDTGSLPSMVAHNDWEIAPMDIEIMRREDGSPWELGAGAFGKVRRRGGVRGVMGALKPSTNPEPPARPAAAGPCRKQICATMAAHRPCMQPWCPERSAGASRPYTGLHAEHAADAGAGLAQVYKGLWNEVQDVAVKMVVGQSAEQQARFLREVSLLHSG